MLSRGNSRYKASILGGSTVTRKYRGQGGAWQET